MQPNDELTKHFRIIKTQRAALEKLGIKTLQDLLFHFPNRYEDVGAARRIIDIVPNETVTVYGEISNLEKKLAWKTKRYMVNADLQDATGSIGIRWFNQPYAAKMFEHARYIKVTGKATGKAKLYFANPTVEPMPNLPDVFANENETPTDELFPVYPESKGVSSKWIYHTIHKILEDGVHERIEDSIPEDVLNRYKLPRIATALVWVHTPQNSRDAQASRKRFAFEEVFLIQVAHQKNRYETQELKAPHVDASEDAIKSYIDALPYEPTGAQTKSIADIVADFRKSYPMSRLLEGDVGSGKTTVAAATMYAIARGQIEGKKYAKPQVAYMVPTEILAKQQFAGLIEAFEHSPIPIGLITGSGCQKFPSKVNPKEATKISRAQLSKWVANGEIPIVVGTHALISKNVVFQNLTYVIIDEQHRFGTRQRAALARKTTQTESPVGESQNNADIPDEFLYKDLSYQLRGLLFDVRKELGLGQKEKVYQRAVEIALTEAGIEHEREKQISVKYKGKKVGVYQPDFIINKEILLELKALPRIAQRERQQTWEYLKGSEYKLAFLANFGAKEMEVDRIVYDSARPSQGLCHSSSCLRESASCLRSSAQQVRVPHLLSMTATPIPRTLALTIYGDLDLSVIDEKPKGRKEIITKVVPPSKRDEVHTAVRSEMLSGRQAYVICPRIDEPDPDKASALRVKSVRAEAKRLQEGPFKDYSVDILHGKMTPKEKDEAMQKFESGKTDVLVATSVVEVGVNVPNATIIIIEGAERFGLSQLHQLRGRVQRSTLQPYCYLFSDTKTKTSLDRIRALEKNSDGFELAEADLKLRGAGQLVGTVQWGVSDLGMEALQNLKMVEAARNEAKKLIESDPTLENHEQIRERIDARLSGLHME